MHHFDGETYDPGEDQVRLNSQLEYVMFVISDNEWYTLAEIRQEIKGRWNKEYSEAGISARLRDLRKERFGSLTIERQRRSGGLWEYQYVEGEEK
jgi:hypothetical protein